MPLCETLSWQATCGVPIILGGILAFGHVLLADLNNKLHNPALVGLVIYTPPLFLCLLIFPSPVAQLYSTRQERCEFKWWMPTGGALGSVKTFLLAIAASAMLDSVMLVSYSYNFGKMVGACLTDHIGFLGSPTRPFSCLKLLALFIFCAGMLLFSVTDEKLKFRPFVFVSFAAGMCSPIQACFNRRTSEAVPYAPQATAVNYLSGFVVQSVTCNIFFLTADTCTSTATLAWYLYIIPGFIGIIACFVTFYVAPRTGLALFTMITIVSETVVSVLITTQWSATQNANPFTWWIGAGLLVSVAAIGLTVYAQVSKANEFPDRCVSKQLTANSA